MGLATNFLDIFQHKKTKRRKFFLFLRILFYVFLTVVILSSILLFPYFYTFRSVYQQAEAGKKNFELAAENAQNLNLTEASLNLSSAEENFREADSHLNRLKFLKNIPWVGKQYSALSNLLTTSIETTSALRDVIKVVDEIMQVAKEAEALTEVPIPREEITFARLTPEEKRAILKKLFESPPELQGAKAKIDLALIALGKIEEDEVTGPILEAIQPFREVLPRIREIITKLIPAAEIIPQIAGYPTPKTYLFLLQNSDELRPTGGFIGTYGIVKGRNGEIEDFETYNIYALDRPAESYLRIEPPWQIKKYLNVNWWFMRDANWSPDFPTSAAQAEWFYHAERGPERAIDAVVAVTPTFVLSLLSLVGNIEMDGETYTPENFMELLQYKVEKEYYEKGIPEIQRKDIVYKLADKIYERLINLPSSKWLDVLKIAENNLEEKHLLIWSKSPELQALISEGDWAGEIKEALGDFLMVVDANMASLKTDQIVDKTINYSLWFEKDKELHARASITYHNKGTFTWKTTRLRTYTRFYVPEGSTLVKSKGAMENDKILDPLGRSGQVEIKNEFGKTYFGAFISIEPGQTKTLEFEYILPSKIREQIEDGVYTLFVQKQAGTLGHPLTLGLDFDKKIKQAVPAEESKEWGDDVYKLQTDLRLDKEIEVGF